MGESDVVVGLKDAGADVIARAKAKLAVVSVSGMRCVCGVCGVWCVCVRVCCVNVCARLLSGLCVS